MSDHVHAGEIIAHAHGVMGGVIYAFIRKEKAVANPWGAGATTLEWTLSSPPPFHQFNELPRIVETHR
jgi:cytochrome c oxidase subunit I